MIYCLRGMIPCLRGMNSCLRGMESCLRGIISRLRGMEFCLRGIISRLRAMEFCLRGMISRLQGFGARYNPNNNLIKIPNLQTAFSNGEAALTAVTAAKPAFTNEVNTRKQLFDDMEKLSTRGINAFNATENVTKAHVADAMTYVRKIRGARKNKKVVAPPPPDATVPATAKQISVSQQSYDQQVEHFSKLIALFASVINYTPNETELQNASLSAFLTSLKNANQAVITATTPYLQEFLPGIGFYLR